MVALMGAEADAVCGAGYGERSDERANIRNGYRRRDWDTRTGSISLADRLCWMAQALAWACSRPGPGRPRPRPECPPCRLASSTGSTDPFRLVSAGPKHELSRQDTRVGNWFESDLGHSNSP